MLTVGVFYTFALCMVEDVDASSITAEYYLEETDAGEPQEPNDTHTVMTETEKELTETRAPEAEAPKHDLEITNVASADVSERDYAGGNRNNSDGSDGAKTAVSKTEKIPQTEKMEKAAQTEITETVPPENSENNIYDDVYTEPYEAPDEELDDIADISDAEGTDAADGNDYYEAETEKETEFKPFADDDEDFLALFTSETVTEETTVETAVSVDVSVGADISTSETFTAKFNGSTQTVNAYDLICWIVNNEMSPSFSDEAIKAQAVAAYSYVKYHNVNGLTPSVLVKKNPSDRIKNLVSEVWGVCCYYNGNVAQTVYMASSSGYTADAEHVWGGSVPYLKSVYCPFDVGNDPNYGSTLRVSESSMRSMLENSLGISLSNNPYNWLKIQNYIDGNYVYELSVDGQKTISGRKLRETVMGHKLKSAAFEVSYSDGEFVFTTYGYGHGVGMSQNGANILAKQGYSYYDILKFYFTGIEVI